MHRSFGAAATAVFLLTFLFLLSAGYHSVTLSYLSDYPIRQDFSSYKGMDLSNATLQAHAENVVEYLLGDAALDTSFFHSYEVEHLHDVRSIFLALEMLAGLAILFLAVASFVEDLSWMLSALTWGSAAAFGILLVLSVWSLVSFDSLFLLMHHVLFRNNLWLLNPYTDNLILLFPEQFFSAVALSFMELAAIVSVIVFAASLFLHMRLEKLHDVEHHKKK